VSLITSMSVYRETIRCVCAEHIN